MEHDSKKISLPKSCPLLIECESYIPRYEPSDEVLNAYLIERQGWKPLTKHYMQTHPENLHVQKLRRYLIVASMQARKKLPKDHSISLIEMVNQNPDAIMHGCAEQDYINCGKIKVCPYPMGGIDENIWKRDYLCDIEEQIARDLSEKQKLPGHACLQ